MTVFNLNNFVIILQIGFVDRNMYINKLNKSEIYGDVCMPWASVIFIYWWLTRYDKLWQQNIFISEVSDKKRFLTTNLIN